MPFPPLKFETNILKLIDQRLLPEDEIWVACRTSKEVHAAIKTMIVRGAPAIGVAAGYGLYLGVAKFRGTRDNFLKTLAEEAAFLKTARPTAVNLSNVIDSITMCINRSQELSVEDLKKDVLAEARRVHLEDDHLCKTLGSHGSKLLKNGDCVLTHCNAGGLATSGYGTALGVIYAAVASGKKISVVADETRPLLQGARLTAWELMKSKIPSTLICDNMAAAMMRTGRINCVIVGADRIAANGDTANKIGTYGVAVLAQKHKIPFYVAAPKTTFDFKIKTGAGIPIEERDPEEITEGFGRRTAPKGMKVWNPAFDVTPHELIAAIITEAGVLRPPYTRSLLSLKERHLKKR